MNLYAEILDDSKVGAAVVVDTINKVASMTLLQGQLGIIKSIQGKVAFISINANKQELAVSSGSALGINIDLPVKATASLSITLED